MTVADTPANEAPYRLLNDVEFGVGVVVHPFTNLYGCRIGDESRIGPFVEIQSGVEIGARSLSYRRAYACVRARISSPAVTSRISSALTWFLFTRCPPVVASSTR